MTRDHFHAKIPTKNRKMSKRLKERTEKVPNTLMSYGKKELVREGAR